ncbi:MAG: glycoside hydrolase family 16 protein [Verrucomicrobiales bacterium]|nr:glycoside hydrolase family 16 protein [Verrucomicrobiales bacterium]
MLRITALLILIFGLSPALPAATITFSGLQWTVRAGTGGPGPNTWDPANVRVDDQGGLHLKLAHRDGRWTCAEVTSRQRFGFGRYRFVVEGTVDRWNAQVVLGLFNYPTGDVGGDGTHEIDIEFARWGRADAPAGNYTIWPIDPALKPTSKTFAFSLKGTTSIHQWDWRSTRVNWESAEPDRDGSPIVFQQWTYAPDDAARRIAQKPMPIHFNLWLFQGRPPSDGKEVEVVIRSFTFAGADPQIPSTAPSPRP